MGFIKQLRKKFDRSFHSRRSILIRSDTDRGPLEEALIIEDDDDDDLLLEPSVVNIPSKPMPSQRHFTEEDSAAIKIQSYFRGHLARRAFRALRSLVKLQAMARGAHVRSQAQIVLRCMHVLVRLQVRVRARQLLGMSSDEYDA